MFFYLHKMQKLATKSETSGHCLGSLMFMLTDKPCQHEITTDKFEEKHIIESTILRRECQCTDWLNTTQIGQETKTMPPDSLALALTAKL